MSRKQVREPFSIATLKRAPGPLIGSLLILGSGAAIVAQRTDAFVESRDHPAIGYSTRPSHDLVAELNDKLQRGAATLAFDRETGYLRATLSALNVPVASQALVFSATSAQAAQISPRNPRAVYFNDTIAVGWVRGADLLEVVAQDRDQGAVFYTLPQKPAANPRFTRNNGCLECHLSWDNLGVPGVMVLTTFPMSDDPNAYASGFTVDHRSPIDQRWGGWYVTGRAVPARHQGNVPVIVKAAELTATPKPPPQLTSVSGRFDTAGYLTSHSDIVALMTLEHQTHMSNLLTRLGWEARVAAGSSPSSGRGQAGSVPVRVGEAARELVDYLLFVDEAPLPGRIEGASGFAAEFSGREPRDRKGRSLRQFDLQRRLMRYPCSYMIYAPAFDALPPVALDAVYRRMWQILSGEEHAGAYSRLSLADRQAVVEILRETKQTLPAYFVGVTR